MNTTQPVHPLKSDARVLLTSIFGPYAQDDEYGSRTINPMELYHNQVTRVQGVFSLRMFHPSLGLMMIKENIDAPCTHLDYPTLDRFIEELKDNTYDIIGISSIIPNIFKVKKMCELIREYQPSAQIVVGGHLANYPNIEQIIDADNIVRGEGIKWFRRYLDQDDSAPIKHPMAISGYGARAFGVSLPGKTTAGVAIPSVGCPMGCNFCSTSALFGGKGKFINFYNTGEELFNILCQMEEGLGVQAFFIMDENFLFHKKRALGLLEFLKKHNKSWSFYVFSSARVLNSYTNDELVELGISWVWLGLEGEGSEYSKLDGVDTKELIRNLQSLGIKVLGSTIIGLENHTPENIDEIIDWSVSHDTDFHQFMLYHPIPGTPLYKQILEEGRLLPKEECDIPDTHGQYIFNYRHNHIPPGKENKYLLNAFQRDFEINGPSIFRFIRTKLIGWKRFKNHPDLRVRKRYIWESARLKEVYPGLLWAMKRWYKKDSALKLKIVTVLKDIYSEFGLATRFMSPFVGLYVYIKMLKEKKKLANGWTYEPETRYEKNEQALKLEKMNSGNREESISHSGSVSYATTALSNK